MSERNLIVAVRVRPLLQTEIQSDDKPTKDILRTVDTRIVVVLDPDDSRLQGYLDQRANRTKEKRYTFDHAFGTTESTRSIYDRTVRKLVSGVMTGLNGTVFAYGATGSGKTYTMVGTKEAPGLMILSLEQIFSGCPEPNGRDQIEVTCSYLEVYNETIYDLLVERSLPLELREDPAQGVQIAGLTHVAVHGTDQILGLLQEGNLRRKTDSTSANKTSSRSHAVLEIVVRRGSVGNSRRNELRGKLCLVDLAGSERAAETDNAGQKLRDGANINRSLLALANCINALGKRRKQGMVYVPYRNSKLTRILKDGLNGNSATAMIATVAASSNQYHHSINTLKYADRAKEIKTRVTPNLATIESHVSDYRRIIDDLQSEVLTLKTELEDRRSESVTSVDDQLSWIDDLATEINENVEERINLQKALFEMEDVNVCNKFELKNLEGHLTTADISSDEESALTERKENLLENIRENEETGRKYRHEIDENERGRVQIQQRVEQAMEQYQSASILKILSTFRLQAVRLQEFQFQMAIRDQIIAEQKNAMKNLWNVINCPGLDKEAVMEMANSEQGNFSQPDWDRRSGPKLGVAAPSSLSDTHSEALSSPRSPRRKEERLNDSAAASDQWRHQDGDETDACSTDGKTASLSLCGSSIVPEIVEGTPQSETQLQSKLYTSLVHYGKAAVVREEKDRERRRKHINLLKGLSKRAITSTTASKKT